MASPSSPSRLQHFWFQVALIDAAGIVIAGLACWFMGYRTLPPYGDGLFVMGVIIVFLGIASLFLTTDLFESRAKVSMALFDPRPLQSQQKEKRQSSVLLFAAAGGVLIAISLIFRLISAGIA
jgi:uncharacterized membrane protein